MGLNGYQLKSITQFNILQAIYYNEITMIKYFLDFEWKQFFRSSYWQKSIALNIILALFAIYMLLSFLTLGIALYPILKEQFPTESPLFKVNDFLFYWILADLFLRFFMQKLPVMSVKPFLTLPVHKSKIVNYVLGKSMLSFFNFLPLFAIIPFGIFAITENENLLQVLVWMFLMLIITLIVNFLNFIIESTTSDSDWAFLPIIVIVSGLFTLNHYEILPLYSVFSKGLSGILIQPVLITIPILIWASLYLINFKLLKKKLYIDASLKVKSEEVQTTEMTWLNRFGSVAPFLQLDLKLLWRNKRPRSSVFIIVMGLFYGLIFYTNPVYKDMTPFLVFVAIFITGVFLISFGQFIPAWDSAYYKMLMSQNIKYKDYLNAKFSLMQWSAIILFVLSIPYVYFGWEILLLHFAAMMYNVGVNTYVLLFAGSFNRKKIDLSQRAAFNYQGTGAVQWLVGFPILVVPILFFYIPYKLINFEAGVATLIILGLIGIVLHQKLMQYITGMYLKSKHKMIAAFDQAT